MTTDRENIVSSYTIVKGSMIEETYTVMAEWDFSQSKKENLDRLRRENFIEAKSDSWLRDVAKVLNRRFDPAGRDRPLALLAKSGCDLEEWKPLLLWHLTRDEFLLKDFLTHWLFPTCYDSSAYRVQHEDLQTYLLGLGRRGDIEHPWTTTTLHRVATGLLRIAADFGLLKGSSMREFAPCQLPERSFIYLVHVMFDKYKSAKKIINAKEWRLFLLCPSDIERELLRLHQNQKLEYEVTDGVAHLFLPHKSVEEFANKMIEFTPGDRCEVTYADDRIEWLDPKSGQIRQARIFIGVLAFSQFTFAWASEGEESSDWPHRKMFDAFGGVPHFTVGDCIKKGAIKGHRHGSNINPGYAEIAAHYMTTMVPAKLGSQNDKALVSEAAGVVTGAFKFTYNRHTFTSITEINYALTNVVDQVNRKAHSILKKSKLELWATQEKHALKPLPTITFEAVEWQLSEVHPDCTVGLDFAYYSVPHELRGKKVRIKLSPIHVEIFLDLERVALHKRDFAKQGTRHVIPTHLPDNDKAYQEAIPQKLLSQALLVSNSLHAVIEELFAKDTLGNLRRAQRLIRRAHVEVKNYGRESAEPRIHAAVEQMRQFNNFRIYNFEATLQELRQK